MMYKILVLPVSHRNFSAGSHRMNGLNNLFDYVAVWTDVIEDENVDKVKFCESLYEKFNIDIPSNYASHAMSVGDVVEFYDNVKGWEYYFCDSFGFRKLILDNNRNFTFEKE